MNALAAAVLLAVGGLMSSEAAQPGDRVIHLIKPQAGFIRSEKRFPAYVGSWGTGKSLALIMRAMMLSEKYPKNLGVIFRKEFTDLRDSTIRDFEDYTGLKINSNRAVVLANGSQILFRHLEELNNIQNMNLGWFGIEQAEELDSDDQFFKLHGRLRRAGTSRSGFIIANTNGHNWIYKLWKVGGAHAPGGDADYALFEANSFDAAAYLPADTLDSWRKLEAKKPKIYRRFILNSWDEADTVDVIIQPEWINQALDRSVIIRTPLRRIVSIDVARFGDDKTTFYAIEGDDRYRRVIGKETHEKKGNMEVVGLARLFAKKHGSIKSYAVDEIGVGSGVNDRLVELIEDPNLETVIGINSALRGEGVAANCYNRRAEIHVHGAELFEAGRVQLLAGDEDSREELAWARYKTIKSNGIYLVEPKDDIKARYGRSPDHADGLLNGLWALPQAKVVTKLDAYERARRGTGGADHLGVLG